MKRDIVSKSLSLLHQLLHLSDETDVPPVVIYVTEEGSLPTLIAENKKYRITNLTLVGKLNGADIRYLREMAGCDVHGARTRGKLSILNLADAEIDYSYGRNGYYYTEYGCCYYPENGKVGFSMFNNCVSLTSIVLPKNVTDIGVHAFSGCVNLRSIVLPDGVTDIGDHAFSDCRNLTSAMIGKGVIKIGTNVFSGCVNLEEFTVSHENLNYQTANGVLFNKEKTFLSAFLNMKPTVYNIPEGVAVIGNAAFADCTNLTSVTIPMSVVKIGKRAFFNCTGLTEIHLNGLIPPVCEGDCFGNVPDTCKLYVPKGAYGSYWVASVWGRFVNIIEE